MRKAIDLHLEGMLEDGEPIPVPTSEAAELDVAV
jgi:predicted RNase H-like HicB family nuclease